jgi:hypothetical protein
VRAASAAAHWRPVCGPACWLSAHATFFSGMGDMKNFACFSLSRSPWPCLASAQPPSRHGGRLQARRRRTAKSVDFVSGLQGVSAFGEFDPPLDTCQQHAQMR